MAMEFNPKVKVGHYAKLDASTVSGIVKIVHVNEQFILIESGLCGVSITMQVRWSEINKINRMIPRKGRK